MKNLIPVWIMFFCILSCNFIKVKHHIQFSVFRCFISFCFLHSVYSQIDVGTLLVPCILLSASTSSAVLRIFPVNTSCPSLLTFAAMLNFYFQTCLCSLENLFLFWLHIFLSFFFCQYDLLYTFYFICDCQVHLYFKKICKIEFFRAFYLNCSKCLLLMRRFEITKCTWWIRLISSNSSFNFLIDARLRASETNIVFPGQ